VSLQGAVSTYKSLGGVLVAAARLRAGWAEPLGDSEDLLPNKRFFAGGATSMRGFKRHKLGPLDDEGAPLGGESKVEASLELRFPIFGRLGGAAFVDAGQVWTGGNTFAFDELEVAAGPGLVIRTPIGPIRGDVGFRLTDLDKTQPDQVYHLSIGHPF
jgi:outer membrane protein insertion porin family